MSFTQTYISDMNARLYTDKTSKLLYDDKTAE